MRNLEILATVLCIMAMTGYVVAGVGFLAGKKRFSCCMALIGWCANLGIFIKNWYINGYPPFASMYQILSDLSLVFVLLMLLIMWLYQEHDWLSPYFCFGAIIPLMGTLFMDRQMRWSLVPALRSVWFVPHVFSYVLSYALCTVAFLATIVTLCKRKDPVLMEHREQSIHLLMCIAFPLMTLALCLGAVWADQIWGGYWNWDVKEVWSLITVGFYLCYFHTRLIPKWKNRSFWFIMAGFASLVVTFLCVNLFRGSDSLHAYT